MKNKLKKFSRLTVILFLFTAIICGQTDQMITPEQRKQANEFMQMQNWTKAAESYETISRTEPQNAGALYRLGVALFRLKKYKEAISVLERSEKIKSSAAVAYDLACSYSLDGDTERAFYWMDKAISAGFSDTAHFQTDRDLTNLRKTAGYKQLEEKLDKAVNPCKYDPAAKQFDFWVGDWDVKTQQGQNAGTNSIQKLEHNCMLMENWTGSLGGTGKSINFFDTEINKWRQIWIDNSGKSTLFIGELKDGSMRFEAAKTESGGKRSLSRLTFTPLNKTQVRQFGESSDDEGKTWTITFDYVYVLKSVGAK